MPTPGCALGTCVVSVRPCTTQTFGDGVRCGAVTVRGSDLLARRQQVEERGGAQNILSAHGTVKCCHSMTTKKRVMANRTQRLLMDATI